VLLYSFGGVWYDADSDLGDCTLAKYRIANFCAVIVILFSMTMSSAVASTSRKVTIPPGWPKVLMIPKMGVRASIEDIALRGPSDLHAPYRWGDVAWYDRGPKPGDVGIANIFGHLDSYCCPAVFYHLNSLRPGDVANVVYRTGQIVSFKVRWSHVYWNSQMPVKWLYGRTSDRGMVLITCTGVFHRDGTGYDHKLLVYLKMVAPGKPKHHK
jgi:Sortase domain